MANPTDPTFLAGFDADAFRAAITSTMEMALPLVEEDRITFVWPIERTFDNADEKGNPYDLSVPATPVPSEQHEDVQIPAAVEFSSRRPDGTAIGQFENPRVVATVLDTHFPDVDGATQALLGGNTYNIDFVEPPLGLGPVTIYRIWMTAVDESS